MSKRIGLAVAAPLAALVLAFAIAAIVLFITGNNPLDSYEAMFRGLGRTNTIVDMLNRATPIYIAGLAAAIGFRMNLFNIGVEGQSIVAAIVAAYVGAQINLWAPLHITVILLVAMATGAAWAGIAAAMKVWRNVDVVISTIMLNAIAISFVAAWLLRRWDPDPTDNDVGLERIPESGRMPDLNSWVSPIIGEITAGRRLAGFLLIAIAVGVSYHVFVNRTRPGYDLRASGMNPWAAQVSGVPPNRTLVTSLMLSGAVAGLVTLPELLGSDYRYGLDLTRGLGFAGLAVALLGRNHAVGIGLGALVFGFLDSSSGAIQTEANAPPEIVKIMQGVIVLAAVVAFEVVRRYRLAAEAKVAADLMAAQQNNTAEVGA